MSNNKIIIINKSLKKKSLQEFFIAINKNKKRSDKKEGRPSTDVYTMN